MMIFIKMNFYPFTLYVNFFFTEAHHKPFPLGHEWVCMIVCLSYSRRKGVYGQRNYTTLTTIQKTYKLYNTDKL